MKTKSRKCRSETLAERDLPGFVAEAILSKVFRGEFREGNRLTEMSLSEQLGVSRTPIREALLHLKGLGLLEIQRNRGAIVRRFDEAILREIYQVRRLLEVEAARKASGNIDGEVLVALQRAVEKLLTSKRKDGDWDLDKRIHDTIARSCANQRLTHEIGRYSTLVQAIRTRVGRRVSVQRVTSEQHLEILNAIGRNSPRKAADAMRRHLEQAEESAVAAIKW